MLTPDAVVILCSPGAGIEREDADARQPLGEDLHLSPMQHERGDGKGHAQPMQHQHLELIGQIQLRPGPGDEERNRDNQRQRSGIGHPSPADDVLPLLAHHVLDVGQFLFERAGAARGRLADRVGALRFPRGGAGHSGRAKGYLPRRSGGRRLLHHVGVDDLDPFIDERLFFPARRGRRGLRPGGFQLRQPLVDRLHPLPQLGKLLGQSLEIAGGLVAGHWLGSLASWYRSLMIGDIRGAVVRRVRAIAQSARVA